MDKVIIDDYDHMTTNKWKRELDEINTYIVNSILKTSRAPFVHLH